MTATPTTLTEDQREYLRQISSVILQFSNTCRALKGLAIAILGTLFGIGGSENFDLIAYGACMTALVIIWAIDTRYHQDERKLYRLYESVVSGELTRLYRWELDHYRTKRTGFLKVAFSWSVSTVYLPIIIGLTLWLLFSVFFV